MKRWIPLILIIFFMIIAYTTGAANAISFENLKEHRETLVNYVKKHQATAPFTYIAIYSISIALSLPVGAFLSILGGFLFPQPFATLYALIGATTGATCIFFSAKTAFGNLLQNHSGKVLKKMESGFQENQASYLLFLRLVPIFPFWLVNLAPALFNVPIFTYIWTTFVGIAPGAFVFTQAGTGLAAILDADQELTLDLIFNTQIKIALCAFGVFSLIPVGIKKIKKMQKTHKK